MYDLHEVEYTELFQVGLKTQKSFFFLNSAELSLIFLWKFSRVSCNPAISNMWHQSDKQKPRVDFSTHRWMNQSLTVHASPSLCGSSNIYPSYLPWVDTVTSAFTLEAVWWNQPPCLTSEDPEECFQEREGIPFEKCKMKVNVNSDEKLLHFVQPEGSLVFTEHSTVRRSNCRRRTFFRLYLCYFSDENI